MSRIQNMKGGDAKWNKKKQKKNMDGLVFIVVKNSHRMIPKYVIYVLQRMRFQSLEVLTIKLFSGFVIPEITAGMFLVVGHIDQYPEKLYCFSGLFNRSITGGTP